MFHCFKQRCNNSIIVKYKKFCFKDIALTQVVQKSSGQFSDRGQGETKITLGHNNLTQKLDQKRFEQKQ